MAKPWTDKQIDMEVDACYGVMALNGDLIKQLMRTMRDGYEQRIKELEDRCEQLERHLDCHESDED